MLPFAECVGAKRQTVRVKMNELKVYEKMTWFCSFIFLFRLFILRAAQCWQIKSKQSFSFNYKINEANSYGILM